ncbi:MAG: hypothetical protein NTW16_11965 [Bacteroidetes bacterium]|nr:hypothetical protein [Bacteroidota bacterium]
MRNTKRACLLLFGIIAGTFSIKAQLPAYQCELRNDSLLTSQVYEFDIYLKNTSAVAFELGNFQAGILINSLIINGGIMNAIIIPGSSHLNISQQPTAVIFSALDHCVKVASKSPPDFSGGSIIPATGSGARICRIRLTNSLPFGSAKPNLSFNFSVFPYNTIVSAFDRSSHLNVNITNSVSHSTNNLNNPLLNGHISLYTVSGSGSFCAGSPRLTVALNNSETDIVYQLKQNEVNDGGEVAGSGTLLTWSNRNAGIYTVSGRRPATYQVSNMAESAVVVMDDPTSGGSVTGGTTISLGSHTDTLRLQSQLGDVIIWQKQVDNSGYSDIPATAGLTVFQETPLLSGTWEYRAIVQNGVCLQAASEPAVVVVSAEPVTRSWIGIVDEKWNNAENWNPAGVPGEQEDVDIPAATPFMPVVTVQGMSCRNVMIHTGASLIIASGFALTVNGELTLE